MPKPQLKHVAHSGKQSWWVGTQLLYFIFFLDASSPYLSPPNHSLHFRRYRKVNIHILLKRGDWCQEWKCASVQVTAKERALLKNIENTRYYYWCIFQEVYFERKKKKLYCNTGDSNAMKIPSNSRRKKKSWSTQTLGTFKVSKPFSKKHLRA